MKIAPTLIALLLGLPGCAWVQEASAGLSVPVTVSAGGRYARNTDDGVTAAGLSGGFRAVIAPSLRLGSHWFAYAVVDARSSSYADYQTGWDDDQPITATLTQGYLGYKQSYTWGSVLIKGGRLASAFGIYPINYDDAKTALIDPPQSYAVNAPIRPDQLACSLDDLIWQSYGTDVNYHCGGSTRSRYGLVPVTLYGIPGVETQITWKRIDARLQITNSSPSNPQSLTSSSQAIQSTEGAGYSFAGGVHAGFSVFRGPYLESAATQLLAPTQSARDFPASGLGVDAEWSHGFWAVQGEWQRFHFALPGFAVSPSQQAGYVQVKRILTPRVYLALRASILHPNAAADSTGYATPQFDSRQPSGEGVLGYRLNRLQLLKIGLQYSNRDAWRLDSDYWPGESRLAVEVQLVTSLNALSKVF